MQRSVLFDMDGVICHTNPYHSKAFEVFFNQRGIFPTEAEYREHMYGKWNSYIFSHFLGREVEGEELVAFELEKEGLFREIYAPHVKPVEGFMDFLDDLASKNYKLGVATSAPRANLDLILDRLGIRSYFGSLLSSEDVTHHKPDPEVYLKSMDALSTSPEYTTVFEDSPSGARAGLNAQCRVFGVLTSHTHDELPTCDHYIDDFTDHRAWHF